jgi:hypothetical protein
MHLLKSAAHDAAALPGRLPGMHGEQIDLPCIKGLDSLLT